MISNDYRGKALLLITPCDTNLLCRIEEVEVLGELSEILMQIQRPGMFLSGPCIKSLLFISKHEADKARLEADYKRALRKVESRKKQLELAKEGVDKALAAMKALEPYWCDFCDERTNNLTGWDADGYTTVCSLCREVRV